MKAFIPISRKNLRLFLLAGAATLVAHSLVSCYSTEGKLGGAPAVLTGDGTGNLMDALVAEPAPLRPNNHLDPIQESHGAISLQFGEDISKTASGPDKEPENN